MMQTVYLTIGAPASGKSTWAKSEVSKNPAKTVRLNNDDLRQMCNSSVYSPDFERYISEARNSLLRLALKKGMEVVIIDNVNANERHFNEVCKTVEQANVEAIVIEKPFYVSLETLLERDAKRDGNSQVGEAVVRKFWKMLGGEKHRDYVPRTVSFTPRTMDKSWEPMKQDKTLSRAVVCDLDGSLSLIHSGRNPYDASTCDQDIPHEHVVEAVKLYYQAGYQILFVSGREDKDRAPTERFIKTHLPEISYQLHMRPTGDMRKDVVVKEEIFNTHIKDKFFVAGWFDDRLQVARWVFSSGLGLFRVNDPESDF